MDCDKKFDDYMGCSNNPEIMANLDTAKGEKVIFSCIVVKYNRWGMKQDRTFMITNQGLYNIKKNECQRRIGIKAIKAVTKSTQANNLQFIVHCMNEYDYMFESDFRKEIFEALKYVYFIQNQHNLPVYGVNDKLKDYATTKKDISNGYVVNQKEEHRIKSEDAYTEGASQANVSTNADSASENYQDEISQWNNEVQHSVANNMYQKNKDPGHIVTLQDFIIKSVIGRGSFGKVFLVQHKGDGKVYAMKSLRKDVILDYDQVESTLLEKKILLEADHPFLVGMEYVFQTD